MADVGHFGCPNFTFDRISGHFRSIRNFFIFLNFWQNGWRRPFFGYPKFTFDRISGHFRSICKFIFYKMAAGGHFGSPKFTRLIQKIFPAAILDVWKSLWIAFLAISDWSAIFGCPKFTFTQWTKKKYYFATQQSGRHTTWIPFFKYVYFQELYTINICNDISHVLDGYVRCKMCLGC